MNVHMKEIWNKMNRKLYRTRLYKNMQIYYKFKNMKHMDMCYGKDEACSAKRHNCNF